MAGLLAEGLNLGLTRMAEACSIASLGQLAWTSDWHIRDETYASALKSSDGQFFQAAGFGRDAGRLNAHYSPRSGFKLYTHLSGCYGPYFTKLIAATASEALHVLDALIYHQGDNTIRRHHTDGGGESDHVFALWGSFAQRYVKRHGLAPPFRHDSGVHGCDPGGNNGRRQSSRSGGDR
jgi:hypothetical protein